MKKFFIEYSNIIGFTITGLVFGFAFFLLFLNFYHSVNLNTVYYKDSIVSNKIRESNEKIDLSLKNINEVNINNYSGSLNKIDLLNLYSKINCCIYDVRSINSQFDKNSFKISDVYDLALIYQNNVLNDCIVKQLYDLDNVNLLDDYKSLIKLNADNLINDISYLKKNIENNSSYYMSSRNMKENIFELTRDSYIGILNSYHESIELIYQLSIYYKKLLGA